MSLKPDERRKLISQQKFHIAKATYLLLKKNNNTDEAARSLQRADLIKDILERDNSPLRRLLPSLFMALTCAVIGGLAMISGPSRPRVHLDVETEKVTIKLAHDFQWQAKSPLKIVALEAEGIETIDAPGLQLPDQIGQLMLKGEGIALEGLEFNAGTRLEIERSSGVVDFYIRDGSLRCHVELSDAQLRFLLNGLPEIRDISVLVPETITFNTQYTSSPPVRLRLQPVDRWRLDGIQVNGLAFRQESPPGTGHLISAIYKGSVRLPEIERTEKLEENDWLLLEKAQSSRFLINFEPENRDRFIVLFQGWASSPSSGPEGFKQQLAPSWVAYFYHQQQVYFLWSAIVFIFGLLFSIRNILKTDRQQQP